MSQTPPPGPDSPGPTTQPPGTYQQPPGTYQPPTGYPQPPAYQPWNSHKRRRSDITAPFVIGLVFILAGAYALLRQFIPQLDLGLIWPIVVIGVGVALIAAAFTRNRQ